MICRQQQWLDGLYEEASESFEEPIQAKHHGETVGSETGEEECRKPHREALKPLAEVNAWPVRYNYFLLRALTGSQLREPDVADVI
jgi:hypothetical protein